MNPEYRLKCIYKLLIPNHNIIAGRYIHIAYIIYN